MINATLLCHPDTPVSTHFALNVSVMTLLEGGLNLCYQLSGDLTQLRIPAPQPPAATDDLWQHTCFEAFVAVVDETRYHEFNFSPSGHWAAYAFSDTRERCPWQPSQAPKTTCSILPDTLKLVAHIPKVALPFHMTRKTLHLGLTTVLETLDGQLTYWALHHPAPRPDFHDRAGFIVTLQQP